MTTQPLPGSSPAGALVDRARLILRSVADPEIPVISVLDLGIVRAVDASGDGVAVSVTPTYAGCPATHVIEQDIVAALRAGGIAAQVVTRLSPPWTTDWITPEGRVRLREYGITPPGPVSASGAQAIRFVNQRSEPVSCPQCGSARTECLSRFGSTACKALYRCLDCREPFEYFKPI